MTDREARRRLHHRLIDEQDRPCLWCGSKSDLEIDRILEGFRGGRYVASNVRVLCQPCHVKRHNRRKFAVGDRVVVNGRCPQWLCEGIRHNRVRTVVTSWYNVAHQCCYYKLGNNRIGDASPDLEAYCFRSYMLMYPVVRRVGRPKLARKCTVASQNQK